MSEEKIVADFFLLGMTALATLVMIIAYIWRRFVELRPTRYQLEVLKELLYEYEEEIFGDNQYVTVDRGDDKYDIYLEGMRDVVIIKRTTEKRMERVK